MKRITVSKPKNEQILGGGNGDLLEIRDLDVSFKLERGSAQALRGIDLTLKSGQIHGLVGESGSGKTVTSTCIMGLLPMPPAKINRGLILYRGTDLLELSEAERRRTRGREIAMVFQEPAKYLNPSLKVGEQITEMLQLHLDMERSEAVGRAGELLEVVGLPNSRRVLSGYPHELSGGMKQRMMIAMAISCDPSILIADEPTTALDVTLQLQILKLILRLRERFSMGVLFISHDLTVVHEIADRVSVIYAGKIVESADRARLFSEPLHPYTQLLLLSIPDAEKRGQRLKVIPGRVPDAEHIPGGCAFHPRCPLSEELCSREVPPTVERREGHTAACHMIGKKWINS
ncbi:MAG: ABC transporter ATP-binding protein [Spirochaetaceae bacterium]|nr:MAG: ABC transporter ATP-binding protein [Spirochaetaceae bacterium]